MDVVPTLSPAVLAIVAGELLFWVLVAAGLATRYLLRRPRPGALLLAGTVLVDLGVLAVAVLDICAGAAPTAAHGVAALYVGVSVAFGPVMIRWADGHAAHRWAGGPRPVRVPSRGPRRARHEWAPFGRWLVAAAITAAVLGLVMLVAGPGAAALTAWFGRLGVVTALWFVVGPLWHLGERERAESSDTERSRM